MRVLIVLAVAVGGCGDRIVLLECPLGSMPQGAVCVPFESPPDPGPAPLEGLAEFATAIDMYTPPDEGGEPLEVMDEFGPEEAPSGDASSQVGVGSPCQKGDDCGDGWTCIGWPGGYCSLLDCANSSCPDGATCALVSGGNRACLADCAGGASCPSPDVQACKGLADEVTEETHFVCYGLAEGAGSIGSACLEPSDCQGPAVCEALTPVGYCSLQGCEDGLCPEGASCAKLDGVYRCLRACAEVGECAGGQAGDQTCQTLKDPEKKPVDVCVPGLGDVKIGGACVNNIECASADCEILGAGRCSQTKKPCDHESDCLGAEFCTVGPAMMVGYCSGDCDLNALCTGAGFCVTTAALVKGRCRSACSGPGDTDTCPLLDGFKCTYGFPLGIASGQYICHLQQPGDIGVPCEQQSDCPTGSCSAGTNGVCIMPCGADLACPFPATCVAGTGAGSFCRAGCLSNADCASGQTCTAVAGGAKKTCMDP